MKNLYQLFEKYCGTLLAPISLVCARLYVGMDFFRSGLLKIEDFEETIENFGDVYPVPFLAAEPAAYLATAGELVLPILLFIGLFTRFAAAGLFVMALVIEIWVFPGTAQHYYWMIIFGVLVGHGGGKLSLDYWLLK